MLEMLAEMQGYADAAPQVELLDAAFLVSIPFVLLTILGSTGSVGSNTVDLVEREPERFAVEALVANRNVAKLAEQARRWRPKLAVTADPARLNELRDALSDTDVAVAAGDEFPQPADDVPRPQRLVAGLRQRVDEGLGVGPLLVDLLPVGGIEGVAQRANGVANPLGRLGGADRDARRCRSYDARPGH